MTGNAWRIQTVTTTTLTARHPTDSHWWGQMDLEPSGKHEVHVRVSGRWGNEPPKTVSMPFVKLDELRALVDRAREQCSQMGFVE